MCYYLRSEVKLRLNYKFFRIYHILNESVI